MTTTENNKYCLYFRSFLNEDETEFKSGRKLYSQDKDLLSSLMDYIDNDNDLEDFVLNNDPSGILDQCADSLVDIYHYDLVKWVLNDINNGYIVNEAMDEYGYIFPKGFDLFKCLSIGQYKYYYDLLLDLKNDMETEYISIMKDQNEDEE